jgi:sugar lactone lactonase YvrE
MIVLCTVGLVGGMMTVSLRAAYPSRLWSSLAAVRSWLVLTLLVVLGTSAFGQGLSPGGPVDFGPVPLGTTVNKTLTFTAPLGGIDVKSVDVVTEGATGLDFKRVSDPGCVGMLTYLDQCVITISFTPTQIGNRLGALTITNGADVVVNTVYLAGVGVGPQFVFAPTTPVVTATSPNALTPGPAAFNAGAAVEDGNGNLFFTDPLHGRILERTPGILQTSPANTYAVVASGLTINANSGLAIDGTGTLYFSSGSNVYFFMPGVSSPAILTIPGITLSTPTGLAVDKSGDLYIADSTTNKIYQYPLGTGAATTLALTGTAGPLSGPAGLALDTNDNLYIADSGHNRIVVVPIKTLVATALTLTPGLSNPTGVAVDAAGTIYIANTNDGNIVEATITGAQFVLTETPNPLPLVAPAGIFIQANGDLTISDTAAGLVDVTRSAPAVNFPTPTVVGTLDTHDDPENLTVQDSGNVPTSTLTGSSDPSISTTAFQLGTATTTPCPVLPPGGTFTPGEVCIYAIDFKPTVVGLNSANLVLTTTAAGAPTLINTVPLTGIGLSTATTFVLQAISVPPSTPTTILLNGSVELKLTAYNADGTTVATDYNGIVTFTTSAGTNGVFHFGTGAGTDTTTYPMTNGVIDIPASSGLQLNAYGVFTAMATADPATLEVPPAINTATSNPIYVVEPDTLTLTSSVNPSLVGQSTTFTLTVASTGGITPTGSVIFFSNGVQIGSSVALTPGGTASLPYAFTAVGTYAITATFTSTNAQSGTAGPLSQVVGLPTAVVLTSSINPSLVNQSTNFTATITAVASPIGSVTFYNGATALGTVPVTVTGVTGTATFPYAFPTAGSFPITAVYTTTSTNADVTSATSNIVTQIVLNPSTLTLISSINPSQVNQSTTFTLTVASSGPAPGGSVTFYSNGTAIGTSPVNGGAASLPYAFATIGTYAITAVYTGDPNTKGGTAGPLSQQVVNSTTITLASSVNPSLVNQSVTFTATISALGTPTGTIKFYDGATLIGTATLPADSVSYTFTTAGTHPITAVYSGDTHTNGATSAILNQVVDNTSSLVLKSSLNPSLVNQQTTFTLTIASTGVAPAGSVTFYSNGVQIGVPVAVNAGAASLTYTFTAIGTYAIKATYTPTSATQGGSATLSQIVLNTSTITLTSSVNPSMVGQSTTLTANLTALGTPTGSVKFYDGATLIGQSGLTGATATLNVSFSTAGTHPLTAVYSGDPSTAPATSPILDQVVLNVTTITFTSSVNPSAPGQSTTLTADLTSLGTPTGNVKFYDGTTQIGQANVTGGMASITVSFSTPGAHNLKAVYSGDTTNEPATATLVQTVLYPSTVTLTTSVNPVDVNANTTLTSTVTSAGSPTGTVTFYAGTTKLGTANLTNGTAALVVSFPTAGVYALTAVYSGDDNNAKATSPIVSQTVLNVATIALSSSNNPVFLDNPTVITAMLTSTGPTPTGTVSFFDGATPLGTVTLVNGVASVTAKFVYAGPHTITALYSGDAVTAPASAPPYTQTVADFSLTVASGGSSSASAIAGGTASYSLVLTPLITATLPSDVTFTVAGLPPGATDVITPSTVAAGSGATPIAFSVTAAPIMAMLHRQQLQQHHSPIRYAPVALGLLALPLAWFRRRKRFGSLLASICLLLAITGGLTGCMSDPASGYYGQTPQTYNLTVTATSGNLSRSTYLKLTVQ